MPAHRVHKTTTEAAIRECAEAGMSTKQMADYLGTSTHMLRQTMCVLGIRARVGRNPVGLQAHNPFNMTHHDLRT